MSLASDRAARPTICAFYCIARQREKAKNGGPRKETAHGCQAQKKIQQTYCQRLGPSLSWSA